MPTQHTSLQLLPRVASAIIACFSLLVLAGWLGSVVVLKSVVPGFVAMNPTTAILFVMTAACLAISSVRHERFLLGLLGRALGGSICLTGVLVVWGYFSGQETGIDSVLFTSSLGGNRMAPNTAICFVFLGLAFALTESSRAGRYLCQVLAMLVLVGASIALLGYGYDSKSLYGVDHYIPMALNTAILFLLSASALLLTIGGSGMLTVFSGSDPGSVLLRRLFPLAIIGPILLGFFRVWGQRAGWYETEFGAAMMVVATVALLVMAILFTARTLNRNEVDRLRAIEALRTSHEVLNNRTILLEAILTSMEDGVVVANELGQCVQSNPAAERILGLSPRGVELQQWITHFGFYLPDGETPYPAQRLPIERVCQGTVVAEEELIVRNEALEETIWISISGRPLRGSSGDVRGAVVIFRDITERKQAEVAIRQYHNELEAQVGERTYELTEANEELSQKNQENELFIYSVSHDLRSPLVNLQGFSKELGLVAGDLKELLRDELVPDSIRKKGIELLDQDVAQSLHFIQTAVSRLGNIIDALLKLSRVGRVEYQWKPIELHSLVVRVVESMGSTLEGADVDLRLGDLPTCYGDETALEQLFANLVGNAVKYRDSTRTSTIEIGAVPEGTSEEDAVTRTYFVRDNGLGIPAAHQEKIFQAFKRAHPDVATGEGMGLAIVRRTVERHGGRIRLDSREGEGSTFFITLPRQAPSRSAQLRSPKFISGETQYGDGTHGGLISGRR